MATIGTPLIPQWRKSAIATWSHKDVTPSGQQNSWLFNIFRSGLENQSVQGSLRQAKSAGLSNQRSLGKIKAKKIQTYMFMYRLSETSLSLPVILSIHLSQYPDVLEKSSLLLTGCQRSCMTFLSLEMGKIHLDLQLKNIKVPQDCCWVDLFINKPHWQREGC